MLWFHAAVVWFVVTISAWQRHSCTQLLGGCSWQAAGWRRKISTIDRSCLPTGSSWHMMGSPSAAISGWQRCLGAQSAVKRRLDSR